jgi:hypothetical protein
MTDERPEQARARQYLRERGTLAPVQRIREHVQAAFSAFEAAVAGVDGDEARRRPIAGEWTVHEVVDHLVETDRPSVVELGDLLRGESPGGPPIPAGLQSPDPLARGWDALVAELKALHGQALDMLGRARDDLAADARAPLVMVINVKGTDGVERPLEWIEPLDWKAYAIVFRLHTMDHLNQVRKILAAGRTRD